MRANLRNRASVALSLLLLLTTGAVAAEGGLQTGIEAIIDAPEYRSSRWGVLVTDQETGKTLYERNADQLFTPASTTKLYSVATALDALGAGYRFETPVYRRGEVQDGRLKGDLILVASGDPTLGGRATSPGKIAFTNTDHIYAGFNSPAQLTAPDPLAGLDDLARQIAAAGIRRVDGEVLVDDRLFEPADSTGSGPRQVTPIVVNDNVIDVTVKPGAAGAAAQVEWRPHCEALQVDARVETLPKGGSTSLRISSPTAGRIVVRGAIAEDAAPVVSIQEVDDPSSWARSLFIEALRRVGVVVDASALGVNPGDALPTREAVSGLPRTALHTSAPFSENAKLILKVSHNLHASMLPLLVAVKHGKRTLGDGLRLEQEFFKRAGVEAETISFGGGAGGSPSDMTSPRATVQLLRAMAKREDFPVYREALPILGVDGTLATVVGENSPARGKVLAKTGTYVVGNPLNGTRLLTSKALAGYLTSKSGKRLVISLVLNNRMLTDADGINREGRALGRVCEAIYNAE
jgi:D-alanyl-D-alanine carboxypeptidase/D-alanyl-D-alanine-endopeptidase (penicillin-binding protein 4)